MRDRKCERAIQKLELEPKGSTCIDQGGQSDETQGCGKKRRGEKEAKGEGKGRQGERGNRGAEVRC